MMPRRDIATKMTISDCWEPLKTMKGRDFPMLLRVALNHYLDHVAAAYLVSPKISSNFRSEQNTCMCSLCMYMHMLLTLGSPPSPVRIGRLGNPLLQTSVSQENCACGPDFLVETSAIHQERQGRLFYCRLGGGIFHINSKEPT